MVTAMIRTILASLTGTTSDRPVLDASIAVARWLGSHVEALYVKFDPASSLMPLGSQMSWEIADDENERTARARNAFTDARKRLDVPIADQPAAGSEASLHFRMVPGLDLIETSYCGQYHDLIVVGRDDERLSSRIPEIVSMVGRPVLVPPAKPIEAVGNHIAIAWKSGPESARALTAAAPLLDKARRVSLINVPEGKTSTDATSVVLEELAQILAWRGIAAERVTESVREGAVGETIKSAAYNIGADLLVMGAYGHSRLREFVLGGATRTVIASCEIPVLMFH